MSNSGDQSIDVERFLEGMREVPAVVTVVTTGNNAGIYGITIGSFVSLSLQPALVCFNVQKSASEHDSLTEADHFVVHVLREDQAHLSDLFARSDLTPDEQFEEVDFSVDATGCPILTDALITFFCSRYEIFPGGDHSIIVGLVRDVQNGTPGQPVVYHRRAYYGIGEHKADHQ